jgi:uncharacterized membrane protein (UPF0127 family)
MEQATERLRLTRQDGTEVSSHVTIADSLWSRFVGLMGRSELPSGEALCIRPCSSIHMFFMRFPIDAVFVDADGAVVRIYAAIKPWRATGFVRRAKACLELPAGTAAQHGLEVGELLELVDE